MQGRMRVRPRFYVFLIFIMVLCFGASSIVLSAHIRQTDTQIDTLTEARNTLSRRESDLREQLEYVKSDDYVIRVARDELSLIMPGEYRYVSN